MATTQNFLAEPCRQEAARAKVVREREAILLEIHTGGGEEGGGRWGGREVGRWRWGGGEVGRWRWGSGEVGGGEVGRWGGGEVGSTVLLLVVIG